MVFDVADFLKDRRCYVPRELTAAEGRLIAERMMQLAIKAVKKQEWNAGSHVRAVLKHPHCVEYYLAPAQIEEFKKEIELLGAKQA